MQSKQDIKLLAALILWAILPSVYLLTRMQVIAISGADINILGQMEWFDLIDETLITMLTVPLYHLLNNHDGSAKRNGQAFVVSFCIYAVFTAIIVAKCGTIAEIMKAEDATQFLRLQAFSLLVAYIGTFSVILFTIQGNYKVVYILTGIKLIMLVGLDYLLIQRFMEIGAAYSEIIANALVSISAFVLLMARGYIQFGKCDTQWLKEWLKIGVWAGLQIVLANVVYALAVVRMVNVVSEAGNYWAANNFIWGWLLIPVTCFAEIIKKNQLDSLSFKNTWRHCLCIVGVWLISVPGWRWFISGPMALNADEILKIVFPAIPFYLAYIISQMIESWFISHGKTVYNTAVSAIVNIIYYGIAYALFQYGVFQPGLSFVIGLFGWGMVAACVLDVLMYKFFVSRLTRSCEI